MNRGSVMFDAAPGEVFRHVEELEQIGLAAPQVTYIMKALKEAGLSVDTDVTTLSEAAQSILAVVKKNA